VSVTPYISGDSATFLWQGAAPPQLIGDFNGWDATQAPQFEPDGPDRWTFRLQLPEDAYIEYIYLLNEGVHTLDPGNPRRVSNGYLKYNNYFYMPEAAPSPWVRLRPNTPRGRLSQHELPAYPPFLQSSLTAPYSRRKIYLYQPPVDTPCPLVLVFDGKYYLRHARLPTLLDNLIRARRIRPLAAALVSNGGPLRFFEYNCSDLTLNFIQEQVLPLAQEHLNLLDIEREPGSYGVMGASMGGLMAMYSAFRMPQVFGSVLSQSGAFFPRSVIFDLVKLQAGLQINLWMDVGRLERLLEGNQVFHELLVSQGYAVGFKVFSAAHNYTAWRDDLAHGLEHLFGTRP